MKSNNLFKMKFLKALEENANVAGGTGSVFSSGSVNAGQFGNQFPSQNDKAYAPGDYRIPKILGAKRKKKKTTFKVQRRPLPGLEM